jgi:hypothetical protein
MAVSEQNDTLRPVSKTSADGSAASTLAPSAEPSVMDKSEVQPPQSHPANSYPVDEKHEMGDTLDEKSADGIETTKKMDADDDDEDDDYDYPKSWKLGLISVALCLSVFCMALVRKLFFFFRKNRRRTGEARAASLEYLQASLWFLGH